MEKAQTESTQKKKFRERMIKQNHTEEEISKFWQEEKEEILRDPFA
jgi:hypothetical protein